MDGSKSIGSKASKGILEGLSFDDNKTSKEENKNTSVEVKKDTSKEVKIKRAYMLKASTIVKLTELKVYHYDKETSLEEIVDEAICKLYELKHNTNKE